MLWYEQYLILLLSSKHLVKYLYDFPSLFIVFIHSPNGEGVVIPRSMTSNKEIAEVLRSMTLHVKG